MSSETLWDLYCNRCGEYLHIAKSRGILTKTVLTHPHNSFDRVKHEENPDTDRATNFRGVL